MIKRSHKKSHGLMSFSDIARHTAESWRTVDDETSAFVTEVARLIMVRFKEIEVALGGALSKSQSSEAERAKCNTSFRPKVVHDPSSEVKVAQRPAQGLQQQQQQSKLLQQGYGVVGVNPPSRLPTMSVNFGGDAGLNPSILSVPSTGVHSIQPLAYVGDRIIWTGQNIVAPRQAIHDHCSRK